MATPESSPQGQRLQRAALAEGARLARNLVKAERRIAGLRKEIAQVEASSAELRDRIALLSRLTGREIPLAPPAQHLELLTEAASDHRDEEDSPKTSLRGAAIRRVAVRLLASRADPLAPIHHSTWLELVRRAGFEVAGRDPNATFLTQVSRSPAVTRGSKPGVYRLDLDAPRELETRLTALRRELSALHQGQQTIEAISSTRQRREQLTAELARVERDLEEALVALGVEPAK